MSTLDKDRVTKLIRQAFEKADGVWVGRRRFLSESGLKNSDIFRHFAKWSEAIVAAGVDLEPYNRKIPTEELLTDWAEIVRHRRTIPTRKQYRLEGNYSPGVFESRFGPWSSIPVRFREFAQDKPEWADVLALLPSKGPDGLRTTPVADDLAVSPAGVRKRHASLPHRPTYGDPIDFRGLRHAPANENGVVFLFGIVARELGYLVEAIQIGFPDCEAKRQVAQGKWQRVRIEFEFESRNFLDAGHPVAECDVIVCWRHNWSNPPEGLEVVELKSIIETLAKSEE